MLDYNDLEIGKVYCLVVREDYSSTSTWLFRKSSPSRLAHDKITCCDACVCDDNEIVSIEHPNINYVAIWNRTFDDGLKIE